MVRAGSCCGEHQLQFIVHKSAKVDLLGEALDELNIHVALIIFVIGFLGWRRLGRGWSRHVDGVSSGSTENRNLEWVAKTKMLTTKGQSQKSI